MSPASEELDPSTLRPFGRYNVNWYNMRIEKLVNEGRVCIFCTLCIVTFSQVFNSQLERRAFVNSLHFSEQYAL